MKKFVLSINLVFLASAFMLFSSCQKKDTMQFSDELSSEMFNPNDQELDQELSALSESAENAIVLTDDIIQDNQEEINEEIELLLSEADQDLEIEEQEESNLVSLDEISEEIEKPTSSDSQLIAEEVEEIENFVDELNSDFIAYEEESVEEAPYDNFYDEILDADEIFEDDFTASAEVEDESSEGNIE
ncbi:MAG TPA: hypothetical protein P5048_03725 [Chlamydiales bacterium]|nr:hypothetical protein [Chlamydiales bacterium]